MHKREIQSRIRRAAPALGLASFVILGWQTTPEDRRHPDSSGALGLVSGGYAPSRDAWLFPRGALAVHTIAVGGYHWVVLGSVYLGFSMSGFIGQRWIRHRVRPLRIGVAAFCTSIWFFLISNLGSWVTFGIPQGETLLQHYAMGIPFFRNTPSGDLFFSTLLFGGFAVAEQRFYGVPGRAGRQAQAGAPQTPIITP